MFCWIIKVKHSSHSFKEQNRFALEERRAFHCVKYNELGKFITWLKHKFALFGLFALFFFIIQESGHPQKENEEMKSTQLGFIFNPPLFGTVLWLFAVPCSWFHFSIVKDFLAVKYVWRWAYRGEFDQSWIICQTDVLTTNLETTTYL